MRRNLLTGFVSALFVSIGWAADAADEIPYGKGVTAANQERLVLDDMADVSDWYNGSPDETKISASDRHAREGRQSLLFANTVDHTRGEKNYPIGWPRTGKDLSGAKLSDWSDYDLFECWICVETSRKSLPGKPVGVGFYHSGHKRSIHFPLAEVQKDTWVKVSIPVSRLLDAQDVQRIQFNISESDYKHGDQIDFYIDRPALVRYVEPAVAELNVERNILFSTERTLRVGYKLVGYKGIGETQVELKVGRGNGEPAAKARGKAAREGELALPINRSLEPGNYWARLDLRDAEGKLIDRRQADFRVIAGPFVEQ
ncbi:MAG: hypothetical protein H8E44_26680 [Planctomycetes bacterium]|nr:hypothetical protein [Planctomycetota bacterium]